MAHRRIGQGVFRFGTKAERQTSLDELGALIDWSNADRVLASLYKAVKGREGLASFGDVQGGRNIKAFAQRSSPSPGGKAGGA
jgi:hypothetical protein